jgi:hypothetical protein
MNKKEEAKKIAEVAVEEAVTEKQQVVDPHTVRLAYSIIENHGKYHVISVEFDPNNLISGKVKKIESNTDKYLIQERLQVLLMSEDLV